MKVVKRYAVYTVYDFEDDIVTVAHTPEEAQKVARYYGGYFIKEFLIKVLDKNR